MRISQFFVLLVLLTGCFGTPELPLLSTVELAKDAPESGLLAPDAEAPTTVIQELEAVENQPQADTNLPQTDVVAPRKIRRGLAALFGRRDKGQSNQIDKGAVEGDIPADLQNPASVATAVADATTDEEVIKTAAAQTPKPVRQRNPNKFAQTAPGSVLPFGRIGLSCGLRTKQLGVEVDRFPEHGKGYRLYDSNPNTTQPRTHYLTGFKDGCPRQFTASLALLDSPVLHEQLLSVKSSQKLHSTDADTAFQKIRAKACRVGRGKPCPEKRVGALEKTTAFVTTYERFGGNASWTEILIHDRAVVANSFQHQ